MNFKHNNSIHIYNLSYMCRTILCTTAVLPVHMGFVPEINLFVLTNYWICLINLLMTPASFLIYLNLR